MMITVAYKGPTATRGTRWSVALVDGAAVTARAVFPRFYQLNQSEDMRRAAAELAYDHGLTVGDEPLGRVNGRTVFAVAKGGE